MALIELKSNLTSLKFGKDKRGGGDSGLPYIENPSPDNANDLQKIAIEAARYGYDFPIRGGLSAITNSVTDLVRIGKFYLDAPKGPLFIAKQIGLQLSNPKMETGKVLGILENTRTYNLGINTLAQTGVNAFGGHFIRHGLGPTRGISNLISTGLNNLFNLGNSDSGFGDFYYNTVKNAGLDSNRLYQLTISKIQNNLHGINVLNARSKGVLSPSGLNNRGLIIDYIGGPDSFLGIGSTTLKRSDYTNQNNKSDEAIGTSNYNTFNYSDYNVNKKDDKHFFGKTKQDFRRLLTGNTPQESSFLTSTDYLDPLINIEPRIGIGNPGKPSRNRSDYSIPDKDTQDKINMLPLVRVTNGKFQEALGDTEKNTLGRDLIKFRFEDMNNDKSEETIAMFFRAFLTDFNDSNNSELSEIKYAGRGEKFYVYNGATRQISFNFKIAAQSRDEMKPLYQKLNYLISTLHPNYKGNFMRGNLIRLTVGDYMWRQPGYLTSLNLSVSNDSPWEIALNEPEFGTDKKVYELPHIIDASVTFIPIYDFLPKKSSTVPFLLPNRSDNNWTRVTDVADFASNPDKLDNTL